METMIEKRETRGRRSTADKKNLPFLLRTRNGWTMQDLSKISGVPTMTMMRMEHDLPVTLGSVEKIAKVYGVPVHTLVASILGEPVPDSEIAHIPIMPLKRKQLGVSIRREASGNKGEQFVLQQERKKLAGTGFEHLVSGVPAENPYNGYDIRSASITGEAEYLEVKSTVSRDPNASFQLTACEMNVMKSMMADGRTYKIARVYDVNGPEGPKVIYYSAEEILRDFNISPAEYKIKRKKEKKYD